MVVLLSIAGVVIILLLLLLVLVRRNYNNRLEFMRSAIAAQEAANKVLSTVCSQWEEQYNSVKENRDRIHKETLSLKLKNQELRQTIKTIQQ